MLEKTFEVNITTFDGLEDGLKQEVSDIIGGEVGGRKRLVSCNTDLEGLYKLNHWLRSGLRILIPIVTEQVRDEDELYQVVKHFEWEKLIGVDQTFSIVPVVHSSIFTHSQYVMHKVKDGIVDRYSQREGKRPSVAVNYPDILLNVHVFEDRLTISLDSSGEPLYKRGYRSDTNDAPLNEVLAAGLVLKSGWDKQKPFYDTMCGSGTILIEAAMIAYGIPPRTRRKHYAFMNWSNYDHKLYKKIAEDSKPNNVNVALIGSDVDRQVLRMAKQNAENAGVGQYIKFFAKDIRKPLIKHDEGIMIINPPYDERLKIEDIELFYEEIGDSLKKNFVGFESWIFSSNTEAMKRVGLRTSERFLLKNGSLDCKFHKYEVYEGSRNEV